MTDPRLIQHEVRTGVRSALSAAVLLKRMSEELEAAYADVRELAYQDWLQYGGEEVTVDGAVIKKHAGRTTYDFKENPAWARKKKELSDIESLLKTATNKFLQTGKEFVDDETGEVISPVPSKSSPDGIAISLK